MFRRGEIYYIESNNAVGSEQQAGRPAIIVSNQALNNTSQVLEVVYLTTQPKKDQPTHVTIYATGRESTALCEQITSVAVNRFGDYCGCCSDNEMRRIDEALAVSLNIAGAGFTNTELVAAKARLDLISSLYQSLWKSVTPKDDAPY